MIKTFLITEADCAYFWAHAGRIDLVLGDCRIEMRGFPGCLRDQA